MKKLLLAAALAVAASGAQAQEFHNNTGCDLEYRQVCIDPLTCAVSYPSTTWNSAPAMTITPLVLGVCTPGDAIGFEVRYASSTGCTNTPVIFHSHITPVSCGILGDVDMGSCSCTNVSNGIHLHHNGVNLHADG
jgi:hypothetical protein